MVGVHQVFHQQSVVHREVPHEVCARPAGQVQLWDPCVYARPDILACSLAAGLKGM